MKYASKSQEEMDMTALYFSNLWRRRNLYNTNYKFPLQNPCNSSIIYCLLSKNLRASERLKLCKCNISVVGDRVAPCLLSLVLSLLG